MPSVLVRGAPRGEVTALRASAARMTGMRATRPLGSACRPYIRSINYTVG
jgi:hypothetical protein